MQAMPTTKAKPKKEKPIPKQCVCGKMPATVYVRGGGCLRVQTLLHALVTSALAGIKALMPLLSNGTE